MVAPDQRTCVTALFALRGPCMLRALASRLLVVKLHIIFLRKLKTHEYFLGGLILQEDVKHLQVFSARFLLRILMLPS